MKKQENLTLVVKKKRYEMIEKGIKTEEYREEKMYWFKRLTKVVRYGKCSGNTPIKFSTIIIKNGYGKNAQTLVYKHIGTWIGMGNPEWGAPDEECFIIKMK